MRRGLTWGTRPRRRPRSEARDLARVLDEVTRYIRRYVVVSDPQARACTLWGAHCHVFGAAEATPYLHVTSAVKQCGKTRLFEVLEPIVPAPWLTGRVSAAVLTQKVDCETPTLLLDESDAVFAHRSEYAEALRSMLNTGYRRSGVSSLCVAQGAGLTYRDFSTFCPKALAGIGTLPDTVTDRSIPIALTRRAPHERVDRFRLRDAPRVGAPLRAQLQAWRTTPVRSACCRTSGRSSRRRPSRPPTWCTGWWFLRTARGPIGEAGSRSPKRGWPGGSRPSGFIR